jgi:hypothetical protein
MFKYLLLCTTLLLSFASLEIHANNNDKPAITAAIPLNTLIGYTHYPPRIKQLLLAAYQLSTEKLTYHYGSADPDQGGMDCSGTIYYLLNQLHIQNVPRQSDEIYRWASQHGHFYFTNNQNFLSSVFSRLKPGDLLFWSGTYQIKRDITHIMIYLGRNKENKPLMFGASDGRPYKGKKMWGVSVFDFRLPNPNSSAHFIGYTCIPGLSCT